MNYRAESVAGLVPRLREHSVCEADTIAMLTDAHVFRLRVPRRYGGHECDTRTLVAVAAELGRAGGTAAWTACAYWAPAWLATTLGDQAAAEAFATPDALVCGTPTLTSTAVPAGGGVVVNGRWESVVGARHARWQAAFAVSVAPSAQPYPVVVLLPVADLTLEDGPDGTSTAACDLFVPDHRVAPLSTVVAARSAPVWAASTVGAVVGTALDARDWFFDGLTTDLSRPMTHTQTTDALSMIDEAQRVAHRLATLVDTTRIWSVADTRQARAELAAVCRLTEDAVYLLATMYGSPQIRTLSRGLPPTTTRLLATFDTGATLNAWHRAPHD